MHLASGNRRQLFNSLFPLGLLLYHASSQRATVLSAITLAELRYGIAASRRRNLNLAKLELFLASFEVVPFDDRAALAYGPLRAYLQAQGTSIGPLDALIAAHALSLGATVVTNNVREFSRVPNLVMENWLAS
jgi:tRNA(fMet)-specific endonuclease VapC